MRAEYLAAKGVMLLLTEMYFNDRIRSQVAINTVLGQAIASGHRWVPVKAKKGRGFIFDIAPNQWNAIKQLDYWKREDWKADLLDCMADAIEDTPEFLAEVIREVALGLPNPDYRVTTKGGVGMRPPNGPPGGGFR